MKYFLFLLIVSSSCHYAVESEKDETIDKKEILLYLSVRDKNYDIFKNDLEGNEIKLTDNPGFDYSPMWNDSLSAIIYYSYVNDSFLIDFKYVSGGDIEVNTFGQQEFNLSPNGQFLINQVSFGDYSGLILSTLDGLKTDTITPIDSYNGRAKWSWESDKIAYISDRDGNNEIYVFDLKTKTTSRLTVNNTNEKYLSWKSGGTELAFTTQYYEEGKPDRNDVFIYDFTSEKITQITSNEFNDVEIAWSPISDRIAFHSTRDSVDHIYIMDSDGKNVKQITKENAYHGEPNWATVSIK